TSKRLGAPSAGVRGSGALLAPLWALPYVPAAAAAWLWLRRTQRNPRSRAGVWAGVPAELAALLAMSTPLPPRRTRQGGRLAQRRLANANPRGFWRFTNPRGLAPLASITLPRIDIVLVAI